MAIKDLSVEDVTKGLINQGDAGLAGRFLNNVNNDSLTKTAQNAGVSDTPVTPSIDVSELGTTQVEDVSQVSDIEGQIRALAGIQTTPEIDNTENILSALGQGTADLQIEAGNLPREQAELEAQAGIPEFQKQQRDVMTQMAQLQAQLTSDLELITEQGRQEGSLAFASAGERGRRARQAAAEMAGLNAVNQALQGNIATAQQAIQQQMDIKYGAIEGQLNAQKTLMEMNESKMNRAEKRLADQRQTEIDLQLRNLEQARELETTATQSIINGMNNGLDAQQGTELMHDLTNGRITPAEALAQTSAFQMSEIEREQLRNLRLKNQQITEDLINQDIKDGVLNDQDVKNIDQSPQGKAVKAMADLKTKMNSYQTLVDMYGTESWGPAKERLDNAYVELQLMYKEAANLGVLAGPDMDLIETAIKDATPGIIRTVFNVGTLGLGSALQTRNIKANLGQAQETLNDAALDNVEQLYARNPKYRNSNYVNSLIMPFKGELIDTQTMEEMDTILLNYDDEFDLDLDMAGTTTSQ